MNTTLAHRNFFAALVFVPAIALTGVMAESFAGMAGAEAQQLSRTPNFTGPGPNAGGGGGGGGPAVPGGPPPCRPGAAAVAAINCRPWTPPVYKASSEEDCSCHTTYKTVGGKRIAVRDCYVLLPNDVVHYCQNTRAIR